MSSSTQYCHPGHDAGSSIFNATYIFNDNENVDRLNLEELSKKTTPVTELIAINSSKRGLITSSQQFGGLANSIFIASDCNISLTNNLWIKKGSNHSRKNQMIINISKLKHYFY